MRFDFSKYEILYFDARQNKADYLLRILILWAKPAKHVGESKEKKVR